MMAAKTSASALFATMPGKNIEKPMKDSYNILLGVTGCVSATKVAHLLEAICATSTNPEKIAIRIVVTATGRYFFKLGGNFKSKSIKIYRDKHDWKTWRRPGNPPLHIELVRWADIFVVAPMSANTMAKIATGICDNLLTCIARAWDMSKPLLFCPSMNVLMRKSSCTSEHIAILKDRGHKEVCCKSEDFTARDDFLKITKAIWDNLEAS